MSVLQFTGAEGLIPGARVAFFLWLGIWSFRRTERAFADLI